MLLSNLPLGWPIFFGGAQNPECIRVLFVAGVGREPSNSNSESDFLYPVSCMGPHNGLPPSIHLCKDSCMPVWLMVLFMFTYEMSLRKKTPRAEVTSCFPFEMWGNSTETAQPKPKICVYERIRHPIVCKYLCPSFLSLRIGRYF